MDETVIPTRVAHAGWEEHDFQGHRVFRDLVGRVSLAELVALSVTGRIPSPEAVAVLERVAAALTVADPRIWPLKVARIASTAGHPILGWCLGALTQDRGLLGSAVPEPAAKLLVDARQQMEAGRSAAEVAEGWVQGKVALAGFGVPVRPRDERLVCLGEHIRDLGRDLLPHWQALEAIVPEVRARRGIEPNIVSGLVASLLDCGYVPHEIGDMGPFLVHHCFVANAVEGARQAPALLRRLPEAYVDYQGPPPRRSPKARAHQ